MLYFCIGLYLILGWWLPWWALLGVGGLAGFFNATYGQAARDGFLSAAMTWWGVCYYFDLRGHGTVSSTLATTFQIQDSLMLIGLVGLGAGLVGLISASLGYWARGLTRVSG